MTDEPSRDLLEPVAVEPREGYRIWLRYADGVEGEVDLSHLAGRGVFKAWSEPGFFERVYISKWSSIAWNNDLELCADALYLKITGKSPEDIMPGLRREPETAEVSRFYGIVVRIADDGDGAPRLRARYGESEAVIGIRDSALLNGTLPSRALGFVVEWVNLRREELLEAWGRTRQGEPTGTIAPLD